MKRYGNLYQQIYDLDNLRLAHQNAKRGKGWYSEVQAVDADLETYLKRLQDMLINHTYKTSEYTSFIKKEGKKEREIFKLPYFPDRICQWAILQVIEPYILKRLTYNTYSAIPGKGIHAALKDVEKAMRTDVPNCQYCLKIDVKKYYPSINHEIMKEKFRKLFKDPELLWLLDEIIDSISTSPRLPDTGIPIGNYLSQYCGNYFLSDFHRWLKEVKKVKRAKSPMLQGFSHALVRFGGKQKAPERSPRCPHLHLVHFAPLIPGPRPMNFAFFHTKGATGLLLTSPQRSDPGPQWGQKKSEPTHYQIHQFAQSNTYSDVFQSLLSIQRSPVYYTLSFYYSTKRATKCKNIFEAFKFLS